MARIFPALPQESPYCSCFVSTSFPSSNAFLMYLDDALFPQYSQPQTLIGSPNFVIPTETGSISQPHSRHFIIFSPPSSAFRSTPPSEPLCGLAFSTRTFCISVFDTCFHRLHQIVLRHCFPLQ